VFLSVKVVSLQYPVGSVNHILAPKPPCRRNPFFFGQSPLGGRLRFDMGEDVFLSQSERCCFRG
jgi:hypothetical protein